MPQSRFPPKVPALAMAEGQRVYTLPREKVYNLSQITIDSEARSEIQSALQRGYEVTVHEMPLNVNGWEGSGYSIIDPENGIGAYKISGGTSGGFVVAFAATVLGILAGLALVSGGYLVFGIAVLAWELINFGLWIEAIENASNPEEFNEANFGQTMVGLLGLMLAPGIGGAAAATLIFGIAISAILTTFL